VPKRLGEELQRDDGLGPRGGSLGSSDRFVRRGPGLRYASIAPNMPSLAPEAISFGRAGPGDDEPLHDALRSPVTDSSKRRTDLPAQLPASADILDKLFALSTRIIQGATLEEALSFVFSEFQDVVPYDRIGFAEVDMEKLTVTARWAKSRRRPLLKIGYSAPLAGSSLSLVLQYRKPRVLNDLLAYAERHPESKSTELIVREGVRSSMTCPLFLDGKPFGFLFFSSEEADTYDDLHVKLLQQIGSQLAMLLMTSRVVHPEQPAPTVAANAPTVAANAPNQPTDVELSALTPDMVLDRPVVLGNGRILIASGVKLTQQSIARLNALRSEGFVSIDRIMVR
jgi:GAF domain